MIGSTPDTVVELDEPLVVITRVFPAPRELVFKAWTSPEHLVRWNAPQGCTIEYRQIDIRAGGTFHSCLRTPSGFNCWCIGVYQEIVVPERIVFTMAISDEHGNRIDSAAAGHDSEWPAETVITVTFTEQHGQTTLTLQQNVRESLAKRTGAYSGWGQMLDRLAEELVKS